MHSSTAFTSLIFCFTFLLLRRMRDLLRTFGSKSRKYYFFVIDKKIWKSNLFLRWKAEIHTRHTVDTLISKKCVLWLWNFFSQQEQEQVNKYWAVQEFGLVCEFVCGQDGTKKHDDMKSCCATKNKPWNWNLCSFFALHTFRAYCKLLKRHIS